MLQHRIAAQQLTGSRRDPDYRRKDTNEVRYSIPRANGWRSPRAADIIASDARHLVFTFRKNQSETRIIRTTRKLQKTKDGTTNQSETFTSFVFPNLSFSKTTGGGLGECP